MSQRKRLFIEHVGQTSPIPLQLEISSCKGIYYYTTDDKTFIDFTSGIGVNNLGHGHKAVVGAIKQQAEKHLHTMVYGEFVEQPQVDYAVQLTSLLPEILNAVYYCTSGSEAVEAALKLAKRVTNRTEIISCVGSYHGSTHGALSIMGGEQYKNSYRPLLPDTRLIRFNYKADINQITTKTAAVIIEVVQAASGVIPCDETWLKALRERCDNTNTMLIFDEVQSGFGRTGELFAFQHYQVIPDMLLLAKAMGGGVPIGALVSNQRWLTKFTHNPVLGHINTFGGNALACAAAKAVLEVLQEQPDIINEVDKKAQLIISRLANHKMVSKITSKGLLMAIHFDTTALAHKFLNTALKEGVVLTGFLFNTKAVRLAPPLTITDQEIEITCHKLICALNNL